MNVRLLADWLDDHGIDYRFRGLHSLYVDDCFDANPTIDLKWSFQALHFQEEVKGHSRYDSNCVRVVLLTDTSFEIDNRRLCGKFVSMIDDTSKIKLPEAYTLEGSDEFIFEQLEKYFEQIKSFKIWLPKAIKYIKISTICKEEDEPEAN